MDHNEFGKAIDLVRAIEEKIAIYGEDLQVAFCLDDDEVQNLSGAVGGAVQIDNIELANPPRLHLMWARASHLNAEEFVNVTHRIDD